VDRGYHKEIAQINNNITTIVAIAGRKNLSTGYFELNFSTTNPTIPIHVPRRNLKNHGR
jgi:hypothetical protein